MESLPSTFEGQEFELKDYEPGEEVRHVPGKEIKTDHGTVVETTVETSHVMREIPEDQYLVTESAEEEPATSMTMEDQQPGTGS